MAGMLNGLFVVLLDQDRSDEAHDGVLVDEDADYFGPPLDLAVKAFDRVGGEQLGPVLRRERHVGQDVGSASSRSRQVCAAWGEAGGQPSANAPAPLRDLVSLHGGSVQWIEPQASYISPGESRTDTSI